MKDKYFSYGKYSDHILPDYYFVRGGRGNGKTFEQTLHDAKCKLMIAQYEDRFFDPQNYVWLIGENEIIPSQVNKLFGIKVVFTIGGGIKLYKECRR